MENKEVTDNELHKEESKSRIAHSKIDRDNTRSKLQISIANNHHPETGLINILREKLSLILL